MGTFDRQRATAARLIALNGQTVTWQARRSSGPAAKPTGQAVTSYAVKMIFLTPKLNSLAKALSVLAGTEIASGGFIGLMAGDITFEPKLVDTVLRGTEVLSILPENGIEKLDPNGEGAILWYVRFQR